MEKEPHEEPQEFIDRQKERKLWRNTKYYEFFKWFHFGVGLYLMNSSYERSYILPTIGFVMMFCGWWLVTIKPVVRERYMDMFP